MWYITDCNATPHISLGHRITLPNECKVAFTVKNMEFVKASDYDFEVYWIVLNVDLQPNPSRSYEWSHHISLAWCRQPSNLYG